MTKIKVQKQLKIQNFQHIINNKFAESGITFSRGTIYNFLISHNYKYKKPQRKNNLAITDTAYNMKVFTIKKFVKMFQNEMEIFYIDESHFNSRNPKFKIWAKKDDTRTYDLPVHGLGISLISAHNASGYTYNEFEEKGVNTERFEKFMINLFNFIDSYENLRKKRLEGKIAMFLDNYDIHSGDTLIKLVEEKNIYLVYGTPNECCFNAAEYLFCKLKNQFYRRMFYTRYNIQNIYIYRENIKTFLQNEIGNFKSQDFRSFSKRVVQELIKECEIIMKKKSKYLC